MTVSAVLTDQGRLGVVVGTDVGAEANVAAGTDEGITVGDGAAVEQAARNSTSVSMTQSDFTNISSRNLPEYGLRVSRKITRRVFSCRAARG